MVLPTPLGAIFKAFRTELSAIDTPLYRKKQEPLRIANEPRRKAAEEEAKRHAVEALKVRKRFVQQRHRAIEIFKSHLAGDSTKTFGNDFGISRARVHQILKR